MCGFVVIIDRKNTIVHQLLAKMTNTLSHRGPDGEGYAIFSNTPHSSYPNYISSISHQNTTNIGFGHRRLSIYDTSDAGKQPMQYKGYWIVFNGAIYNFVEIKKELKKEGYVFYTNTDTEVIIAAYDYWGEKCLSKFNGMWAFVIYNPNTQSLFISRDRFAIKPLYYYQNENILIFASEIKALLHHPAVKTKPNMDYIQLYQKTSDLEHLKETSFQNIYRFNRASYYQENINSTLNFKEQVFWELKEKSYSNLSINDATEQYFELLQNAVKLRLRADVKVGAALSGGLDSSSIVYLINQLQKESNTTSLLETFSSVYPSKDYSDCDESIYINELSKTLNVHSNQIEPKAENIIEEYIKMIYHLENPPPNTLMSSWHTFKLVNQHRIKVSLDGQGADEQLAGYLKYIMAYQRQSSLSSFPAHLKQFSDIKGASKYLTLGAIIKLISPFTPYSFMNKMLIGKKLKKYESLQSILHQDFFKSLISLLHYADSTSMAFSVESRMPFMDYKLVEFTLNLPSNLLINEGWTKYIARTAMNNQLPNNICWRRDKMGWPIPEKQWLSGPLYTWFKKSISNSSFIKETRLNTPNFTGKNLPYLTRLLGIAHWHNTFFENA